MDKCLKVTVGNRTYCDLSLEDVANMLAAGLQGIEVSER